ncbi:MAG TPA: cytochrome P460 family protein [Polyangiaceae bacterium]|nr:cytochrome P460 family protein [Polyangiaceae bacterium]
MSSNRLASALGLAPRARRRSWPVRWLCGLTLAAACSSDSGGTPLFPANYADSFTQVRDCRQSIEHAAQVRVLADPQAAGPYLNRDQDFPEGAVVLKEEYDFGDEDCTGPIQAWTVMVKQAAGSHPQELDWAWQKVSASRKVTSSDEPRCIVCHHTCGVPPDGYDWTCAVAP